MENLNLMLFLVIFIPLILMLSILKGYSRTLMTFLLIGIYVCLFSGEVNGYLLRIMDVDRFYMTLSITPVVEEILKALPLLFFIFLFNPSAQTIYECAMCCGIGFAIQENVYILSSSVGSISLSWALSRGIGAGFMHGLCTLMIGVGMSFVKTKKKLFYTGTFALLQMAIVYHASYNLLVQSKYPMTGLVLPLCTYIPMRLALKKREKREKIEKQ